MLMLNIKDFSVSNNININCPQLIFHFNRSNQSKSQHRVESGGGKVKESQGVGEAFGGGCCRFAITLTIGIRIGSFEKNSIEDNWLQWRRSLKKSRN